MFILTLIRKLFKLFSSDSSPEAVAFGVSFGFVMGCVPFLSGFSLLLLLGILIFRVQLAAAILAWGLARLLSVAGLARLFEGVGERLLDPEGGHAFWTWLLNLPVMAWLGLESYAILGGAVVGLVGGALLFYPVRQLIVAYRRFLHEKLASNKFFRWLTNFWVVKALRFVFVGGSR